MYFISYVKTSVTRVVRPLEKGICLYGELLVLTRPLITSGYQREKVDCLQIISSKKEQEF